MQCIMAIHNECNAILCNSHFNYGCRHLNGSAQLWGKVANVGSSRLHVCLHIFSEIWQCIVLGELRCLMQVVSFVFAFECAKVQQRKLRQEQCCHAFWTDSVHWTVQQNISQSDQRPGHRRFVCWIFETTEADADAAVETALSKPDSRPRKRRTQHRGLPQKPRETNLKQFWIGRRLRIKAKNGIIC